MHKLQLVRDGYVAVLPLMVGVAPFGVVFGALAAEAGLSFWEALGMSVFVLAGSSQFVAVGLIADAAPVAIIIFTTFIINLRHFLYSASLTAYLRPVSTGWKFVVAYFMVDEVYAGVIKRQQTGEISPDAFKWYFLGGGLNLAPLWWITTITGVWLGNIIAPETVEVLSFSLPLVFTAIVVPLIIDSPRLLAALTAASMGILLAPLPHHLNLVLAALTGIGVGLYLETRQLKNREIVVK